MFHKVKRLFITSAAIFLIPIVSLVMSGCTSGYNIQVGYAPDYPTYKGLYPTSEVDVVGVNSRTADRIKNYPANQYFEAGNDFRAGLTKYKMYFSDADSSPKVLSSDQDVWTKWEANGATTIYVIANLPGVWKSGSENSDYRKLEIPFSPKFWSSNDIDIEINPDGLVLITPEK